jgi:hypothetical protein
MSRVEAEYLSLDSIIFGITWPYTRAHKHNIRIHQALMQGLISYLTHSWVQKWKAFAVDYTSFSKTRRVSQTLMLAYKVKIYGTSKQYFFQFFLYYLKN